jgi:hypothetical protein
MTTTRRKRRTGTNLATFAATEPASMADAGGSSDVSDVIERLSDEFGGRIDAETIRRVAIHEVALFEGAKVRTYVPMIAWRLARYRLSERLRRPGSPDADDRRAVG